MNVCTALLTHTQCELNSFLPQLSDVLLLWLALSILLFFALCQRVFITFFLKVYFMCMCLFCLALPLRLCVVLFLDIIHEGMFFFCALRSLRIFFFFCFFLVAFSLLELHFFFRLPRFTFLGLLLVDDLCMYVRYTNLVYAVLERFCFFFSLFFCIFATLGFCLGETNFAFTKKKKKLLLLAQLFFLIIFFHSVSFFSRPLSPPHIILKSFFFSLLLVNLISFAFKFRFFFPLYLPHTQKWILLLRKMKEGREFRSFFY